MAFNFESMRERERKEERREEIIDLVRDGSLKPDKADQLAIDEGLDPFTFTPDPDGFDIMRPASWTLELVVAWIIWRDASQLLQYFPPFREASTYWKPLLPKFAVTTPGKPPQPVSRYEIENREKAGLQLVREDTGWRYRVRSSFGPMRPIRVNYDVAIDELRAKLENGDLTAHGIKIDTLTPVRIEPFEWRYFRFSEVTVGPSPIVSTSSNEAIYREITFLRSDVMECWKVPNQQTAGLEKAGPRAKPSSGKTSPAQIRNAINEATKFFSHKGYLFWTKAEAEAELREMLGATRKQSQAIFAEPDFVGRFPGEKGRRGTPNSNRTNELEQFRQFFKLADMRN